MLKYSARSSSFHPSVNETYLERATSQPEVRGKRNGFLLMLPKLPKMAGLLIVFPGFAASGTLVGWKALGVSQLTHFATTPLHDAPLYGSAPAIKVPRSLPIPVPEISVPCKTVIGRPAVADTMPLSS